MSENLMLGSKTEEKKYLIEIMQAEDEEHSIPLYEMESSIYGNLSADHAKSVKQAQKNFDKQIRLHSLSSHTVECSSSFLDLDNESPMKTLKKNKYSSTVEELRICANAPKAFRDAIGKRKVKSKYTCTCIIA